MHLKREIGARREKELTHYIDDWQSLISIFLFKLKKNIKLTKFVIKDCMLDILSYRQTQIIDFFKNLTSRNMHVTGVSVHYSK